MIVLLRCPNCGTTRATPGACEACHAAEVRYFCTNHKPGHWLAGPTCPACGASFGAPPRRSSAEVMTTPARTRHGSAPPRRVGAPPPPLPAPPAPPPGSGPDVASRREPTPPVFDELERGAPVTPAWLTLLRHVMLARRRSGTALPERVRSRRGAGGCLLRAALLVLLLFLALVASVVMFGWSLLQGY